MTRYMLDTKLVGHLVNRYPAVVRRVLDVSMASLCISAGTEGELVYGLEKRPDATRLHRAVAEFLPRVGVVPWDRKIAARYGALRAAIQRNGKTLASLDLLIAAHSLEARAVLVANAKTFRPVPGLGIEDWTVWAKPEAQCSHLHKTLAIPETLADIPAVFP